MGTKIATKTESVKVITEDGDSYGFENVSSVDFCIDKNTTTITIRPDIEIQQKDWKVACELLDSLRLTPLWWAERNKSFNDKQPLTVFKKGCEGRKQVLNYLLDKAVENGQNS